jgi:hypothetical protein
MKLVIFGLSISSSRGNGHATIWRGLRRALACRGRQIVFYERDVPYYSTHRDLTEIPGGSPILGDRREGLDQFFTPGEEILSGRPARLPRGDQTIEWT